MPHPFFDFRQGRPGIQLGGHTGHSDPFEPTGSDPVEVAHFRADIQRQAVKCDAVANGEADAAELVVIHPNAVIEWIPARRNAEIRDGSKHHFLQGHHQINNAKSRFLNIDDGVDDQLSGAVIGDVSSPLDLQELDMVIFQEMLGYGKIFASASAAHGQNRGVLNKEDNIPVQPIVMPGRHKLVLKPAGYFVRDQRKVCEETSHGICPVAAHW